MFRPNLDAKIRRKIGRDLFGKEAFDEPFPVRCGVVNMSAFVEATSVRADSTASRGAAEELVLQSKILVPVGTPVAAGDLMYLLDLVIEITSRTPRVNTQGEIDHLELRAKIRKEL